MKAQIRHVNNHGVHYDCLAFVCPGCMEFRGSGLHLLPINTTEHSPSWTWDGNLYRPTLTPSIMTKSEHATKGPYVCHSFLEGGVFRFLGDCTHSLVNQHVDMPDLPDWFINETNQTEE